MRLDAITIPAFAIFATASLTSAAASAASVSCESLATLALPDTTISIAALVPAGTFDPPGATPPIDTAACRVAGSIKPTSDSDIQFEVWMPLSGWNGKPLQFENRMNRKKVANSGTWRRAAAPPRATAQFSSDS